MTEVESTTASDTPADWESRISSLLQELSTVQGELLSLLGEKREALAAGEYQQLGDFTSREATLVERLERCHQTRQILLDEAAAEGLPSANVRSLAAALTTGTDSSLGAGIDQARKQSRLLQHHSLTNWVVVQRTLIHLSQMIEIIATGGRMTPTYGSSATVNSSGALVDQSA